MKARINSTQRKKINRNDVNIVVHAASDVALPRTVFAEFKLDSCKFKKKAKIILEATGAGSEVVQRFDFGTIGKPTLPQHNQLDEIESDNLIFTLKVVDQIDSENLLDDTVGLLLGVADNLHPVNGDGKSESLQKGILPVESNADLGNKLWALDYRSDAVYLLVNKEVPEFAEKLKNDVLVAAIIYPAIIRDVLFRIIADEDSAEDEEEGQQQWINDWKKFAKQFNGEDMPKTKDTDDDIWEWIETSVEGFCKKFDLKEKIKEQFSLKAQ